MRLAATASGLAVLGFLVGTTAVAFSYLYSDTGPCPVQGYGDGPWQWWPYGHACPDFSEDVGAATVTGTLVAIAGAYVALVLGWWMRDRAWGRGVFAGTLALGAGGAFIVSANTPPSLIAAAFFGAGAAVLGDWLVTPRGERALRRSTIVGTFVAGAAEFVAVLGAVNGGWIVPAVGLVLAVVAAGGTGWLVNWALDELAAESVRPEPR